MQALDVGASLENLERIAARAQLVTGADKVARKRTELARAALETLATLGYARTSLREIAQNTEYSHGVLHYYFKDKLDLITCCVGYYKSICVTRYDDVVVEAETPEALLDGFCDRLAVSLRAEAPLHRLWYDLRAQALFEDAFSEDVAVIEAKLEDMVWRISAAYCALSGGAPTMSRTALYAVFDGLFQRALFQHIHGDAQAADALVAEIRALLPVLVERG
ncbi:TetR/AcrR family transcriptional regulator [Rhodovulum sp. DZ06]|uniref:TetR/AcrR family transcriptional regulator n=1 Tax=Rhodovulum sp. DZ06 TaxID=3425126 RepID=UPI003D34B496